MEPGNPVSVAVVPMGQIDRNYFPDSPHLYQQAKLFSKKQWMHVPRTREQVERHLCPWGDVPNHEHPAVTSLTVPDPGKWVEAD